MKRLATTLTIITIVLAIAAATVHAAVVRGRIVDGADTTGMVGATVTLTRHSGKLATGAATGADGSFALSKVDAGRYIFKVTSVGYEPYSANIVVGRRDTVLPAVTLKPSSIMLAEAVVVGAVSPVTVKEDTTEYNASSYKTRPNAAMEELLKRLPGVEVDDDGNITAAGKPISKILVDGKEFFTDDPKTASKNLPASMIDKLQVIDQMSDLAQLTGVDDGEEQTVINVVVKKGMKQGWMGNTTAGAGTDDRYNGRATVSRFMGDNQFTVLGGANNTGSGQGLNTTQNVGANMSVGDKKVLSVNGSVNYTHNKRDLSTLLNREYTFPDSSSFYNSDSRSRTTGNNTTANWRIKWHPDSFNTLEIRPTLRIGHTSSLSQDTSLTRAGDTALSAVTRSSNFRHSTGNTLSAGMNVVYNYKWEHHRGRSTSLQVNYNFSNGETNTQSQSHNVYYRRGTERLKDQLLDNDRHQHTITTRVAWIEPLGNVKNGRFLEASWGTAYHDNYNDKRVDDVVERDSVTGLPLTTEFNESQSNDYNNRSWVSNVTLSYRQVRKKYNLVLGATLRTTMLSSKDIINPARDINPHWTWNVAPQVRLRYRFSKTRSLNVRFNTSLTQPTVAQLQPVADESNPQRIVVGNPNLRTVFNHQLTFNFKDFDRQRQRSITVNATAAYIQNSIVNTTTYDSITAARTQSYRNVNGSWNARASLVLSLPVWNKRLFITTNAGTGYTQRVGYNNSLRNLNRTFSLNVAPGVAWRTQVVELELRPHYSLQSTRNTVGSLTSRDVHNYGARFISHIALPFGLIFDNNLNYSSTSGYSQGYNTTQWLWDSSVAYEFLRNRAATVSLTCHDMLGQRKNITRGITASYQQDIRYNSLTRYVMLSFTYKFKTFSGGK